MLLTAPATVLCVQFLLGCGLAAATWTIVSCPTDAVVSRIASDRVVPEMHLVLGTLVPEVAVNLERLFLWLDLRMRAHSWPSFLRYPVLNLVAFVTAPLFFAIIMLCLLFVCIVLCIVTFGLLIPFVVPTLGLLLGYAIMVPVWVASVYLCSFPPLLLATIAVCTREGYLTIKSSREHARARRMVRQPGQPAPSLSARVLAFITAGPPVGATGDGSALRAPHGGGDAGDCTPRQPWLSKRDLLRLYQQRGLLTQPAPPPAAHGTRPPAPGELASAYPTGAAQPGP